LFCTEYVHGDGEIWVARLAQNVGSAMGLQGDKMRQLLLELK
jgi:hypothetical protein